MGGLSLGGGRDDLSRRFGAHSASVSLDRLPSGAVFMGSAREHRRNDSFSSRSGFCVVPVRFRTVLPHDPVEPTEFGNRAALGA